MSMLKSPKLTLIFALGLAACGDSTSSNADASMAQDAAFVAADASSPDATSNRPAWDTCTQLTLPAAPGAAHVGNGATPMPAGGPVDNGAYVASDQSVFGASRLTSDEPVAQVIRFDRPGFQRLSENSSANGTWTSTGTQITFQQNCRCERVSGTCDTTLQTFSVEYTATPTTYVVFSSYINGGTSVFTFTKE